LAGINLNPIRIETKEVGEQALDEMLAGINLTPYQGLKPIPMMSIGKIC
jgi:hypothetical protein